MSDTVLGYFAKFGGEDADRSFSSYLWETGGFTKFLKKASEGARYGDDLQLLLVQYFVAGKFTPQGSPQEPRLFNYSKKNKDIAVAFSVTKDEFHSVSDRKRRQFIVTTTLQAIDMVESRLGKRDLDIDFAGLRRDVKTAAKSYLKA